MNAPWYDFRLTLPSAHGFHIVNNQAKAIETTSCIMVDHIPDVITQLRDNQ